MRRIALTLALFLGFVGIGLTAAFAGTRIRSAYKRRGDDLGREPRRAHDPRFRGG